MRGEYIELGGAEAFVEHWGQGQSVLCLHTAGQGGWQWKRAARTLAELGYHVIVPDLPGHGRSDPAPQGAVRDLGVYAAWCESLIERLALHRPFVVGCSIGGKISLELACRRGPRLAGVIAMAADGGMPAAAGDAMARGLERELADAAAPSRSDRTYLGTLAVVGRAVPQDRARYIGRMHRREDPDVSVSDLIGWAHFDRQASLPEIECPVHLVVGSDDLWMDAERARHAAQSIPGARYTLLEGIGHYPMQELEDPGRRIHGWLREFEGAAR